MHVRKIGSNEEDVAMLAKRGDRVSVEHGHQGETVTENSVGVVSLIVEEGDSEELQSIILQHLPEWAELFARKNSEYQDGMGSAFVLGARGQFSDMWRKMMKLKIALWEGQPEKLTTEPVEEVLLDMAGHIFLTLEMLWRERDAEAAKAFTSERQEKDLEALRAKLGGPVIDRRNEDRGPNYEADVTEGFI